MAKQLFIGNSMVPVLHCSKFSCVARGRNRQSGRRTGKLGDIESKRLECLLREPDEKYTLCDREETSAGGHWRSGCAM